MDLENTLLWGNTGTQWLQVGGWVFGSLLVGLILYWLIEYLIEPFLVRRNRLIQALSDLVQQGILVSAIIFGFRQAFTTLTPSFIVLTLEELFTPIAIGFALLWFAIRLYKWATPDNEIKDALVSQIVPLIGIILAVAWIFRFWITRPLTCVPNCTGQSALNADLSGLGLGAVNLVDANLRGADLSGTNLVGADLSGANLNTTILRNADLSEAVLIGADLTGADLRGAILDNTDFSGAILTQANLTQADLTRANLSGATLIQTTLIETTLTDLNLAGLTLIGANLTGADLSNANLHGAYLSNADLSDVTLVNAELIGALANLSNFTGVNLKGANLAGASFIGTNLTSANLSESNLVGATLIGTNLKGADLRGATLTGTRLLQSEFLPSDRFIDTVLFELNELQLQQILTDANLNGVNFNLATIWPEGKNAFLSRLLGDLAVAAEGEGETTTAEVVDPDFRIIGQPGSESLNKAILGQATESGIETIVDFSTIDPTLAFGVLCSDETIAMLVTNQPIREAERSACEANEQFPTEILIAIEAFVFVAHPQNEFVKTLTADMGRKLLTAERWSEVDARWPNEPVLRYLPALETAELALFTQWVDPEGKTDLADAANSTFSSNPLERIDLLTDAPNGFTIVDYGTYLENSDSLLLLEIEDVTLSAEKVAAGEYPFVQPLYLYLNRNDIVQNQQVSDFLAFYLSNVSETAPSVGYFSLDPQLLTQIQAAIGQAQAGDLLLGDAIIETAAIAPNAPVITDTVPMTATQPVTVTASLTAVVAVGDQSVAPPLLTAYSQIVANQPDLSLAVTPLPQLAAWAQLCQTQTADLVMTTETPPLDSCPPDTLIAIPAGVDTLGLVLHPQNSFASNLTTDDLLALLFAETWSEANAAWPNAPLTKLTTSTTLYQRFVGQLGSDDPNLALSLGETAVQLEPDIAQLVAAIANNPNSIGIVSVATLRPFLGNVQLATIDGVEATADTYPFIRPLFLYTTTQTLQAKPFVRTFLATYLAQIDQTSRSLGYTPPTAEQTQRAQARLDTIPPQPSGEGSTSP